VLISHLRVKYPIGQQVIVEQTIGSSIQILAQWKQGDQIGRVFALRADVYFGQLFKNLQK
jgi:hypothetical protein